jgi:N-acetylglucosaminyldiphosphoundecaprenol N-acetyl-beta-D-mannosaminyltransferase
MELKQRNPSINVVLTMSGSPDEQGTIDILKRVTETSPHFLLVAFGAPKQDLWIDRFITHMPSVRVAMGVGGTFDFLAGTRKRAPTWLQRIGLEWLWRFVQEPSRYRRMWNAVVVFPFMVLRSLS